MLYAAAPDTRIVSRPNTLLLRWRRRGNTLRILLHCLREVPDVYFFPREGPLDAAFLALRRRLRLKTAVVTYVVSGGLYNSAPIRATLARNVTEADSVYGNCRYLAELVRERCGTQAGVRYDGIDRRFFFPVSKGKGSARSLTVLFAGSFRPYKRVDLVIRQAACWPEVKFRLLGQGEEEQNCKNLAAELGCSNVTFAGHLSSQQVGEEMRQADIFFFPSILEGHPQVLGQAAACGLPCVAMNIYRPEYVVHGKTGYLADSDSELGEALARLLAQPALRNSMGEAAALHSKGFNWDGITLKWAEGFAEAIAKRRRR